MDMRIHRRRERNPHSQAGFTMVEVMVALVVLAIGLLGIAALLLKSLQSGRTATYRTEAVNLAADLADRIRANRTAQAAYGTLFGEDETPVGTCDTVNGCSDADLASTDLAHWKATIAELLPEGDGQVVVTLPAGPGEPTNYVVAIQWTEQSEAAPVVFQIGFAT